MNTDGVTIILCGGPINRTNLPTGTRLSNAMIPVNGKPVISWILDELIRKKLNDVVVVLRKDDIRLQSFLQRVYSERLSLQIVRLEKEGSIVQSLSAGLLAVESTGSIRINLGDTLIFDSFEGEDFLFTGEVEDSRRWCLVNYNSADIITEYIDKQELHGGPFTALAGYYHLTDGKLLKECVISAEQKKESELSSVLRRYGAERTLRIRPAKEWIDFGHVDSVVKARRTLLRPRYFNTLSINPVLNTITKISENQEKLQDELDWYLNIPDELKVLTPRIVSYERQNGQIKIVQEHYGYPTLAELYVYGDLHKDTWLSMLRHVMRIHREFLRFTGSIDPEAARQMYAVKTFERFEQLQRHDAFWKELLNQKEIMLNQQPLSSLIDLKDAIHEKALTLSENVSASVIHGDFCFSNILFDINNQIVRLIDPRGSFGVKGVFGDPRYDIAKLRHSVSGFYDFIVADMFDLRSTNAGFETQYYNPDISSSLPQEFDEIIVQAGYDLEEIKFIEGLLFISMLPLHTDHPKRQQMMYLTGLQLLNEVFQCV